ncbi:MAG: hypothetical protein II825_04465 [Paludibacteraceae bacterium]|nr:hypothetical protein [Paludibacteraceae bacterium]
MKKVLVMITALVAVVMSAKAEVDFAYEAGAEIVSCYIWRGQNNGALSFQPEVLLGFDAEDEKIQFRIGAWGNIGASDWKFKKDQNDGSEFTRFMPEVDVIGSFSFFGASVGFNHYYYCDGSNFFSWKGVNENIQNENSSTTEVWAGYSFDALFGVGAYINWYTTVAGNDYNDPTADDILNGLLGHRAWSSYLEVGYDYTFENIGLTLGAQVGMSPWESPLYGNEKFAVTNIAVKIDKEFDLGACTLNLFALGSLNPDGLVTDKNDPGYNVFINEVGYDKLYNQKLNGTIGLGIWF